MEDFVVIRINNTLVDKFFVENTDGNNIVTVLLKPHKSD